MEVWTPRVGGEAAELVCSVWLDLFRVPLLGIVWASLIIAGGVTHTSAVWILGVVALLVEAWLLVRMAHRLRRFHRAAARALGVHVGWNEPPSREDKYVAWCRRKGIEPFRAGRQAVGGSEL